MFERLQQLPLFQGLSINELSYIVSRTRLEFMQYSSGDTLVEQGENCNKLIYVLDGDYSSSLRNKSNDFVFVEQLGTPNVIEVQSLFGRYQRYQRSYVFNTEGSTLSISRNVLLDFLLDFRIIKLNVLNLLASKVQHYGNVMRENEPERPVDKIVKLIRANSECKTGAKHLYITMDGLAGLINEPRLNVSRALKIMEKSGLIKLKRGEIHVDDLYELAKHDFSQE